MWSYLTSPLFVNEEQKQKQKQEQEQKQKQKQEQEQKQKQEQEKQEQEQKQKQEQEQKQKQEQEQNVDSELNTTDDASDNDNESYDYFHKITPKDYITRILIIGSTKNAYSANETTKGLTEESEKYIQDQIDSGNGNQVLDIVRSVYVDGRAPKQDNLLMVHAMLCRAADDTLRKSALALLQEYRTIAQIYMWKNYHSKMGGSKGFGRAVKRNMNQWILQKTPEQLAYQITKYIKRGDWGFADLLKCIHTKTGTGDDRIFDNDTKNVTKVTQVTQVTQVTKKNKEQLPAKPIDLVLRYAVDGFKSMSQLANKYNLTNEKVFNYLSAVEYAKTISLNDDKDKEKNIAALIKTIQEFKLTREQITTAALSLPAVQTALLANKDKTKVTMPMTALMRNLANLTRIGVFDDEAVLRLVLAYLKNTDAITKSYIHPVSVLTTWFAYRRGHGKLSSNHWSPIPELVSALEEMFYLSFKNLEPTGKRLCFLIDCSGSMIYTDVPGCDGITSADVAALLAMVFARAEANQLNNPSPTKRNQAPVQHSFYLFSGNTGLFDVSDLIHAKASFNDVLNAVQRSDFSTTNISHGILESKKFKRIYDGFVVITDNDVNSGIKPSLALQEYRDEFLMPTKMAIVATQMNDLSIADPTDKYMMDFCGFDSHLPKILQEFISGKKSKCTDSE